MEYIKEISLPIDKPYNRVPVFAKQGDYNSRFLHVSLTKNDEILTATDIGNVTNVAIGVKRRMDRGCKCFRATYNNDGTFTLPLPSYATKYANDDVTIDLMIWAKVGEENKLLRSASVLIHIEASGCLDETISNDDPAGGGGGGSGTDGKPALIYSATINGTQVPSTGLSLTLPLSGFNRSDIATGETLQAPLYSYDDKSYYVTATVTSVESPNVVVSVVGFVDTTGATGAQGAAGENGENGQDGLPGLSFLYSTADSSTSVPVSSFDTTYGMPIPGDLVSFSNGDVRRVTNVGTISDPVTLSDVLYSIKGAQGSAGTNGADGQSATITEVTASVDNNVGTPSVDVTLGGTPLARTIDFDFHNLKGAGGSGGGSIPVVNNGTSNTTATIQPNTLYIWGEVTRLNITLATPTDNNVLNEYHFFFESGDAATRLSLPNTVLWNEEPDITTNTKYEVIIVNNCGKIIQYYDSNNVITLNQTLDEAGIVTFDNIDFARVMVKVYMPAGNQNKWLFVNFGNGESAMYLGTTVSGAALHVGFAKLGGLGDRQAGLATNSAIWTAMVPTGYTGDVTSPVSGLSSRAKSITVSFASNGQLPAETQVYVFGQKYL